MKRRGVALVGAALGAAGALAWSGWTLERVVAKRLQADEEELRAAGLTVPSEARSQVIEASDGGRIHAIELGSGPCIVLLHGITLNASIFAPVLRAMSATHRVIAIDLRGHGNSVAGSDPLTMERVVQDVAEAMVALNVKESVLVGHSMGGMVAQQLLVEHADAMAERVAHLVLLSSSAGPGSQSSPERFMLRGVEGVAQRGLRHRAAEGEGVFPSNDAAIWLARVGFGRRPDPAAVELAKAVTQSTPPGVVATLLEELFDFDGRDYLVSITQAATVMVGTLDVLTPPRHARAMASLMRNAEYQEIRGAGHMIMLEATGELIARLEAASWRSRHPSA